MQRLWTRSNLSLIIVRRSISYNFQMDELVMSVDGRERRATVYASSGPGPLPVVVLLHGTGGSGGWAVHETRWDEVAKRDSVLLVAPDATRPDPRVAPRFYTNPQVWNDGSNRPPVDRVRQVDDVAFIRALLDELPRRWNIDANRICVTGFSNGAGMTFRLGLELADRLAAIAPVAGHLSVAGPRPGRPVPAFYLIGTADPLIPMAGGKVRTPWTAESDKPAVSQTLARWAELMGLPPEPAMIMESNGVRRERWGDGLLQAWSIEGLGHHWPGGRGELNKRIAGEPFDSVDATRVIWDFFRAQRR
jgi:polyhydroxybutyrate depolymerase